MTCQLMAPVKHGFCERRAFARLITKVVEGGIDVYKRQAIFWHTSVNRMPKAAIATSSKPYVTTA